MLPGTAIRPGLKWRSAGKYFRRAVDKIGPIEAIDETPVVDIKIAHS